LSDDKSEHLARAYALKTPDDSVQLYRDWAGSYDETFVRAHGYVAAREAARAFLAEAGAAPGPVLGPVLGRVLGPVLDIGAGTGQVGEHLRALTVDGVDISREMLDVAAAKGLYRRRIVADLTQTLPIGDASYGGLISSGTFTHGHVGPACLPELMRVARAGALFVLSIKPEVFDEAGFGSAFAALVAARAITPIDFRRARIYENATHDHTADTTLLAVFRRR
jgi:SAM-dependent methyltransferase